MFSSFFISFVDIKDPLHVGSRRLFEAKKAISRGSQSG
jgi:hypothetical protein